MQENNFGTKREEFISGLSNTTSPVVANTQSKKQLFSPDIAYNQILENEFKELANMFDGTPQENLIAFLDSKVQTLIQYIISYIMFKNEQSDTPKFPLDGILRYKSVESTKNKIEEWSEREDRKSTQIPDYCACRIVADSEQPLFYLTEDPELEKLETNYKAIKKFIDDTFERIKSKGNMTFDDYCSECTSVLTALANLAYASQGETLAKYYKYLINDLVLKNNKYARTIEDHDKELLSLGELSTLSEVNIIQLLNKLSKVAPNELMLYQLNQGILEIINNSETLKSLGVTISNDELRTKDKYSDLGYRSKFIGLDLSITMNNGNVIILPIELQLQTKNQYEDQSTGFSSHTKISSKSTPLKAYPKTFDSKKKYLLDCKKFLESIMHETPDFTEIKFDSESQSVKLTPKNLFESYRQVSQRPIDDRIPYMTHEKYFKMLQYRRGELFPSNPFPEYIKLEDIPDRFADPNLYSRFFKEFRASLDNTMNNFLEATNKKQFEDTTNDTH